MLDDVVELRIDVRESLVQQLGPLHNVAGVTRTWPDRCSGKRDNKLGAAGGVHTQTEQRIDNARYAAEGRMQDRQASATGALQHQLQHHRVQSRARTVTCERSSELANF